MAKNNPVERGHVELSAATIRQLRSQAHHLKPVVRLGQSGLTDAVCRELDGALNHHELVKIKLNAASKTDRQKQVHALCSKVQAQCIQQIGHTATLFRRNPEKPVISLA